MAMNVVYGLCDCRVWPLVRAMQRHRCGYCGVKPEESFENESLAIDAYYKLHGRLPR